MSTQQQANIILTEWQEWEREWECELAQQTIARGVDAVEYERLARLEREEGVDHADE